MLRRHYNSREILNNEESQVDGLFSELIYSDLHWHALTGLLLTKNSGTKTGRGEVDFILVCEHGVLVVEVKGGIITYTNGQLIQRDINSENERPIDPFGQVRNNCDTIRKSLQSRLNFDVFVGEAVVFPQSSFQYRGEAFQHFWHMESQAKLGRFLEQTVKKQAANFAFPKLKREEILQIVAALAHDVNWETRPQKFLHSKQETERRSNQNYRILKGLEGNNRLLIEGPPGSGKSTFAQKFILDKVAKDDARVLYLCWNELLAVHTRQLFLENGVEDKVEAFAFFDYVNLLYSRHPVEPKVLAFSDVAQLYSRVENIIADLQSVHMVDRYDLIVIDEAQDLFDKGIDIILDKQLNDGKNGLSQGDYIVFYDSLQAFDNGTNSEIYHLVYYTIKSASAFYRLFNDFRTIEGSGIANFLDDAVSGSIDFLRLYGGDMLIKTYRSLEDCFALMKTTIRTVTQIDKVKVEDMVILFSSNLVSGHPSPVSLKPMDDVLLSDSYFEKIANDNLTTQSDKIRYTTALKFKGLEKDFVLLVVKDLFDEKIKTFYQLYIGASRAKAKVVLLVDEESVRTAKKQQPVLEASLLRDMEEV